MEKIPLSLIEELKKKTEDIKDINRLDCKKALEQTKGNLEEALELLRKGLSTVGKNKDSCVAAEGLVGIKVSENAGVITEVNSQTDFIAKDSDFRQINSNLLEIAFVNHGDRDKILSAEYVGSHGSVAEKLQGYSAISGEKISLRRSSFIKIDTGIVASYLHNGVSENLGEIGVLVALRSSADKEKLKPIGKQIAMHIAALSPRSIDINDLDQDFLAKEKEAFMEEAKNSGKPMNVIEKMVEGRMRKIYEEVILLEQIFIMDGKMKVSEFLSSKAKELGTTIEIDRFIRYKVGEGIEKEAVNFAEEVAAMSGKK